VVEQVDVKDQLQKLPWTILKACKVWHMKRTTHMNKEIKNASLMNNLHQHRLALVDILMLSQMIKMQYLKQLTNILFPSQLLQMHGCFILVVYLVGVPIILTLISITQFN
jgi:hypothetical protein